MRSYTVGSMACRHQWKIENGNLRVEKIKKIWIPDQVGNDREGKTSKGEVACSAPSQTNVSGNCYIENKCSSVLSVRADAEKALYIWQKRDFEKIDGNSSKCSQVFIKCSPERGRASFYPFYREPQAPPN